VFRVLVSSPCAPSQARVRPDPDEA
jgi:hypothetical protein